MATQINSTLKPSGGSGLLSGIGTALGMAAGAILAVPTGGASLAGSAALGAALGGAATGAGLGAAAGGIADKIVDPVKGTGSPGSISSGSAISRRAAALSEPSTPPAPSAILEKSLSALNDPSISDQMRTDYGPVLQKAYDLSKRPKGQGGGVIA